MNSEEAAPHLEKSLTPTGSLQHTSIYLLARVLKSAIREHEKRSLSG